MNKTDIQIVKRDGGKEPLNLDKMHFVVEQACEGLSGVSASQIEMNSQIQFTNNMSTTDIQEIMIRSANDLITLDTPNYQYAAARLLLWNVYKEVFKQFQPRHLIAIIDQNIKTPGIIDLISSPDIYIPLIVFFCLIIITIFLRKLFYKK